MGEKGSVYPPVNGKGGNIQVKHMHVITYFFMEQNTLKA